MRWFILANLVTWTLKLMGIFARELQVSRTNKMSLKKLCNWHIVIGHIKKRYKDKALQFCVHWVDVKILSASYSVTISTFENYVAFQIAANSFW